MSAYVVDTNVPIVANGHADHADEDCVLATLDALQNVKANGMIVIDMDMLILNEYMSRLNLSGQPGPGDVFLKWVWSVQADTRYCEQVQLNKTPKGDFLDFPDDPDLSKFDRSDRKFVVVALKSNHHPLILNAVDNDWSECREALQRNGVQIKFLCPQHCR